MNNYQVFRTIAEDNDGNTIECFEIKSVFKYDQSVELSPFQDVDISAPSIKELKIKLAKALEALETKPIIDTV